MNMSKINAGREQGRGLGGLGRGGRGGGQNGGWHNNGYQNGNNRNNERNIKLTHRTCKAPKHQVFIVGHWSADKRQKTAEQLWIFISEHHDYGHDIANSFDKMKHVSLDNHKRTMLTNWFIFWIGLLLCPPL